MKRISLSLILFGFLALTLFIGSFHYGVSAEKHKIGEIGVLAQDSTASAFFVTPRTAGLGLDFISSKLTHAECPSGTPLDCSNGWCCPRGHTLHCPRSTCQDVPAGAGGCYNPDKLTNEQLAYLRNCCPALTSCS